MKKLFLIMIVLALVLTSCNTGRLNMPEKPNNYSDKKGPNIDINEGGIGAEELSTIVDIEQDINYIDIIQDRKLTTEFMSNNGEKKDILYRDGDTNRVTNTLNVAGSTQMYVTLIPDDIDVDIRYHEYDIPLDYLLITSEDTTIYSTPSLDADILGKAGQYSKVKLEGRANLGNTNNTNEWYLLSWLENSSVVYGYVTSDNGVPRKFRFDSMSEEIKRLEYELNEYKYGYISNYKDRNGSPPLMDGKALDRFGIQAYQSAPAFYSFENKDDFRYFPDGMIVFILDERDGHFQVRNLAYEGEYWVPKNYVSFDDNLDRLSKVVVIDKTNQNQGAFENIDGRWTLISYTLATTGVPEGNKYETPTGSFKVLQKRDRFYYLNSRTKEIGGYAPYGTRFSAGAYIHGVPVDYIKKDGENIDPGLKEYLMTIGTTPRSAKCVRNYTSHAKFIYDWVDMNDTAVIVID